MQFVGSLLTLPLLAAPLAPAFPQPGLYQITQTGMGETRTFNQRMDVSSAALIEATFARGNGGRCRDREFQIGNGSFRLTEICDAPDGDIHNIRTEMRGTYTASTIDITTTYTMWGRPMQVAQHYRLIERDRPPVWRNGPAIPPSSPPAPPAAPRTPPPGARP